MTTARSSLPSGGGDLAVRVSAARSRAPLADHAALTPPDEQDAVAILEAQSETRIADLVPVRYGRMLASPSRSTAERPPSWPLTWRPGRARASSPSSAVTRTSPTSASSDPPSGDFSSISTTSTRPGPDRSSGTSNDSPPAWRSAGAPTARSARCARGWSATWCAATAPRCWLSRSSRRSTSGTPAPRCNPGCRG